jgi:predicted site-specific integrase-resolvase
MLTAGKKLLPTRIICARYEIVDRTVDRWVSRGVLPAPLWINGRRYWDEQELERRERDVWRKINRRAPPAAVPESEPGSEPAP